MSPKRNTTKQAEGVAPFDSEQSTRAVVKVGGGRGFVMELAEPNPVTDELTIQGIIITAAHCLPHLPPAPAHETTYSILGLLDGKGEPTIKTECLFVDPVADLAVLGSPDDQVFAGTDLDAWYNLMENTNALTLKTGKIGEEPMSAWLLSLDGTWHPCTVKRIGRNGLSIENAMHGIVGGMSGSPILSDTGRVIGLVSNSGGGPDDKVHTEGGPSPSWLIRYRCGSSTR